MKNSKQYPDRTVLITSAWGPTGPTREVTVEKGGIRVDKFWFYWNHFFEVNTIISVKK